MSKKQKYYVVWSGINPGIYHSWEECQKQIKGFEGAKFKSFTSLALAEHAFEQNPQDFIGKEVQHKILLDEEQIKKYGKPIVPSIAVDAACSGNPGTMEYQGVETETGALIFHKGPFPQATVNIGEFLAIVHALAYMKQKRIALPIYSDSMTALSWVKRKKANTKLIKTKENAMVFELLHRAEKWLHENSWTVDIMKWETNGWGEIPADFGRK